MRSKDALLSTRVMRHARAVTIAAMIGIRAVTAGAERLPIRTYSAADGLPHNEINRIVRDSRGFLWFCTGDGLSRFDGYGFSNFTADQGLPPRGANDLLETRDGGYWVATDGGLVRFNPKATPARWHAPPAGVEPMFTVVPAPGNRPRSQMTTALLQDKAGTIWVGTGDGLYRLADTGRPELAEIDIGMPADYSEERIVTDVVEDGGGVLWIGTPAGLYARSPDGAVRRYTVADGLPDDYIHDLLLARDGRLWVATRRKGFFVVARDDRQRVTVGPTYQIAPGLGTPWIFQLFESGDGHIWAGTNSGLVEIDGRADGERPVRTYTTAHGLSYHEITAINEDSAGNIWLGTNTVGVMRLARGGIVTYGPSDNVSSVNGLFEDAPGVLCFRGSPTAPPAVPGPADSRTRFGCLADGRASWFYPAGLASPGWVVEHVTLRSRTGEWWVGTGDGLYRFPGGRPFRTIAAANATAHYDERNGLPGRQVFRLFEDSRGDVWVSTISVHASGLARWERASGAWTNVNESQHLPSVADDMARSFAEDGDGHVWIGFEGRLIRSDRRGSRTFGAREGVPPGAITEMIADHAGRIWFTSSLSGLTRIDERGDTATFTTYTTRDGLSSNAAQALVEDLAGRIYVGTGRGLDRLDPATSRIKHYTTADGLAPGLFRAAYRDHAGDLWFGMTGGLSRFVPGPDAAGAPPAVIITGLVVGGARQPISALGETAIALPDLQAARAQVQIEFVGLEFASGETVRYRLRLDPQSDWSTATELRSVNYANLRPGSYRVLVEAVTSSGLTSPDPAVLTFVVLRPVWQRWWFVLGAVIGVAAMGWAAIRYRMTRLLELANLRTRIALDLHDDIGSNLTRIAILSEVARQRTSDTHPAGESVASISRIARESVAAMSDIVWAINPQRDRLIDLVRRMRHHLQEVSAAHGVAVEFRAPTEDEDMRLDAAVRRDLFLIFKEAVNNAVRHAQSSRVDVQIVAERSAVTIEVADNGRGFDRADLADGHGLDSMRHRSERIAATLEIESSPGRGTVVRVTVPRTGSRSRPGPARA